MPSASLVLVHAPGVGVGAMTDHQIGAREHVFRALEALGGMGSPAGSCVWHVVGLQSSLREWSMRQGWGGRAVRHEAAQGIWWRRSGIGRSAHAAMGQACSPRAEKRQPSQCLVDNRQNASVSILRAVRRKVGISHEVGKWVTTPPDHPLKP
jgi:hypothetical protein